MKDKDLENKLILWSITSPHNIDLIENYIKGLERLTEREKEKLLKKIKKGR